MSSTVCSVQPKKNSELKKRLNEDSIIGIKGGKLPTITKVNI